MWILPLIVFLGSCFCDRFLGFLGRLRYSRKVETGPHSEFTTLSDVEAGRCASQCHQDMFASSRGTVGLKKRDILARQQERMTRHLWCDEVVLANRYALCSRLLLFVVVLLCGHIFVCATCTATLYLNESSIGRSVDGEQARTRTSSCLWWLLMMVCISHIMATKTSVLSTMRRGDNGTVTPLLMSSTEARAAV